MLKFSVEAMQALSDDARKLMMRRVLEFLSETYPHRVLPLEPDQQVAYAERVISECIRLGIRSFSGICTVIDFLFRWGHLSEPRSAWIRAFLEGGASETEKVEFLEELLCGG